MDWVGADLDEPTGMDRGAYCILLCFYRVCTFSFAGIKLEYFHLQSQEKE